MKKSLYVLFLLFTCTLFSQAPSITKGLRRIKCEVVPIIPLSKSFQVDYQVGQKSHPFMSSKTNESTNWSGYSAFTDAKHPQKHSVSSVCGYWTVPKLSPSHRRTFCSTWVGIDGYSDATVEQLGTEQDWRHGRQKNYAWFSLYPAPTYEIVDFPVDAKDMIAGFVSYQGNDVFEMTLVNITKGVFFTVPTAQTTAANTKRNSANWIVEAPFLEEILPLAHFNTISFSECFATISDHTGSISNQHWTRDRMQMVTNVPGEKTKYKAKTSSLSRKGQNFSVKWRHE